MIELRRRMALYDSSYIPSKYQQVEYLESTGTQYIITDIIGEIPPSFYRARVMFTNTGRGYLDGSRGTNPITWINILQYDTSEPNRSLVLGFGSNWSSVEFNFSPMTQYDIYAIMKVGEYPQYFINNISYILTTPYLINRTYTNQKFYLFARSGLSPVSTGYGRIYLYEIGTSANELTAQFIPCYRKSDLVAGMYDRVNRIFYTNAGTGTFIVGPDVT